MEWTLAASLAAGAALWLSIRPPPSARLRDGGRGSVLPRWVQPVPQAMSVHQRGLAAASLAGAIVGYRDLNGPFPGRAALRKVPGLGPKAFEQAAGFLIERVRNVYLDVVKS